MNRTVIAIIVSVVVIAVLLAGTYVAFTVLATQIPPGRTLGMLSAALMVASGLACAGVGYVANKWIMRGSGDKV